MSVRAGTYIPEGKEGWWGKPDLRLRCKADHKVVFANEQDAIRSANKATNRGTPMKAYRGKCGYWHTSRIRTRSL